MKGIRAGPLKSTARMTYYFFFILNNSYEANST